MTAPPDPRQRAWARFLTAQAMLLERIEAAFAEAELPPLAWYDVLWILESTEHGRLRMADLARKAVVSRSNVTRLTDRMEKEGLVARFDCPVDGRGTVATLTAKGRAPVDLPPRQTMPPLVITVSMPFAGCIGRAKVAASSTVAASNRHRSA